MTQTTLHPYFGYRDAPGAIDWLGRAFGFEPTTAHAADDDGGIAHAELRLGDAVIIVFSDRDGYERPPRRGETTGLGTYLTVADHAGLDALYTRAVDAGAVTVWKPETSEWGNHRFRVVDPEGYEWSFGTYRPGESWS